MKKLCIYHGRCDDGFGAAFAIWKRHGEGYEYYPGVHGDAPPDVQGREVIIVDFSYPRAIFETMAQQAKSLLLLDHHQTAEQALQGLPNTVFDQSSSGAMMSWRHFHPDTAPPRLIEHIQDNDLWRFEVPDTYEVMLALRSYPQDFTVWDGLRVDTLIQEGQVLARSQRLRVKRLLSKSFYREIAGYRVPVVNAPSFYASEVAGTLAKGEAFAVVFCQGPEGFSYSLRSDREGGVDVAKIAEQFGGGGHRHAAGFRSEQIL